MSRWFARSFVVAVGVSTSLPLVGACSASRSQTAVVVDAPPPPPRRTIVEPRPGYVWAEGAWVSRDDRWVWNRGTWVRARPGHLYVQGRWMRRAGRWHWVEPRWERRDRHRADRGWAELDYVRARPVFRTHDGEPRERRTGPRDRHRYRD
jgi:WXXGXW repeat (2 copies)